MVQAENERMHLLTFLQLKQPGWFMRTMVLFTQVRLLLSALFFICAWYTASHPSH